MAGLKERNTLEMVQAKPPKDNAELNERTELKKQILTEFDYDAFSYYYKGVPEVAAFTDYGDAIGSELDNTDVAIAMTTLAKAKGWTRTLATGSDTFYSNAEKLLASESEELKPEHTERKQDAQPETSQDKPTPDKDEPTPNELSANKVTDADESALLQRQSLAQSVYEQYRVAGSKYYFKDQAGHVNQLAFKDSGDKLSTALNTERVTRSLVELADAKGWSSINLSGHTEFKRQAWRTATERGIEVSGYEPDDKDLAVVSDKALKNTIEQAPSKQRTKPTAGREYIGELIEHGPAPYQHKPENKQSYYVSVNTDKGKRTVWGVALADAVTASHVQPGDAITLTKAGVESAGKFQRNTWTIERDDKRDVIVAVGKAVAAEQIKNPDDRQRIAQGIQARIDSAQQLPQVQVYDNKATTTVQPTQTRTKEPELVR